MMMMMRDQVWVLVLMCFYQFQIIENTLIYPTGGGASISVSLSTPVKLPNRVVFLGYGFSVGHDFPKEPFKVPIKLFAAIAVPLDLPHRSVFVSYNFEANYNLPNQLKLPPIKTENEERLLDSAAISNSTIEEGVVEEEDVTEGNHTQSRQRRSLLSRTNFYSILESKLLRAGFDGEPCILRLICETNASNIGEVNGVLGNIFHIIFSPSTSMDENLPLEYYEAEVDGTKGKCKKYWPKCKDNILDLVSAPIENILNGILNE